MHGLVRYWLVLACLTASCGSGEPAGNADSGLDDDAVDTQASDTSRSFATASGTVGGASLDPVSALSGVSPRYIFVFTSIESNHHEVVLTSFADHCGNTEVTGRMLYLDLFEDPSMPDSLVTQPNRFEVWLPQLGGGEPIPTDNRAVATFAENGPDGGTGAVAQAGSVTVTTVTESVIAGTFDLDFENGHLTGSFEAPLCDVWMRNASIPGPARSP